MSTTSSSGAATGAFLGGVLNELAVSASTIAQIKEILGRNIEDLEAKPMDRTSQSAFGQSDGGTQLGHHTSIAERHVVDAINNLVTGLDGYRESVEWAWRNFEDTDGGVSGSLTGIADRAASAPLVRINESTFDQAASCVDQPDLATNPSCDAPTGDS